MKNLIIILLSLCSLTCQSQYIGDIVPDRNPSNFTFHLIVVSKVVLEEDIIRYDTSAIPLFDWEVEYPTKNLFDFKANTTLDSLYITGKISSLKEESDLYANMNHIINGYLNAKKIKYVIFKGPLVEKIIFYEQ